MTHMDFCGWFLVGGVAVLFAAFVTRLAIEILWHGAAIMDDEPEEEGEK